MNRPDQFLATSRCWRHLDPRFLAIPMLLVIGVNLMADPTITNRAKAFVANHEAKFRPLDRRANLAWWNANVTGKDEDFAEKEAAQNAIDAVLADPKSFVELKELKRASEQGQIDDPLIRRCIDVLYLMYLEKQVDPELLKKSSPRPMLSRRRSIPFALRLPAVN